MVVIGRFKRPILGRTCEESSCWGLVGTVFEASLLNLLMLDIRNMILH